MDKPLVSIIVPVFNTEDRIAKCISSIQHQTYRNIEIIVVNDGSTDKTQTIISELANADNRIKLLTFENGGTGFALSKGLQAASGKYIGFSGADDWIEPGMYEKLILTIIKDNADLVVCNILKEEKELSKKSLTIATNYIANENILEKCIHFNYDYSICNKLFKMETIKKYNIDFVHELRVSQDLLFNLEVFSVINKITVITDAFYHYVAKEGSLMTSPQTKRIESFNRIIELYKKFCIENNKVNEWKIFEKHIGSAYQSYFFNLILKSDYTTNLNFNNYYSHVLTHLRMLNPLLLNSPLDGLSIYQKFRKRLLIKGRFRVFSLLAAIRHKSFFF